MPEHDNDKLENFFQKAASKPEISFHEEDWKKLEARLDAEGTDIAVAKKPWYKIAGAVMLAALIFSGIYWTNQHDGDETGVAEVNNSGEVPERNMDEGKPGAENPSKLQVPADKTDIPLQPEPIPGFSQGSDEPNGDLPQAKRDYTSNKYPSPDQQPLRNEDANDTEKFNAQILSVNQRGVETLDDKKIFHELIQTSPVMTDKIKQKAGVILPGAEEADIREKVAIVQEEPASDEKKHLAAPRVSLLLSLAPDFSGTAMNQYTAPGKAYGLMIHYHIKNAWSISGGIIKNKKKYTGDGEDYKPPKGYWKYYTNGIIPYSIDGSCSILEFPVMLQYTVAETGKGRFLLGAGASSYLMLNESYRYNFEEPNPGTREGWDSKHSSRFAFNMLNFTVGYERQIFPGVMIGIEPYIKIPIEEIGWSNLKLFSSGASLTLRYSILKKTYSSLPTRSRGPD